MPHGITTSPEGEIVVAQAGEIQDDRDSLLLFFGAEGDFLDSFETGLNDVYGIAYGPNQGRLFAVDFCNARPNEGGLYKLVATREGCRAVKFGFVTASKFAGVFRYGRLVRDDGRPLC